MSVPKFIQDARRFARLADAGVELPELIVSEEIVAALEIDAITLGNLESAESRERIALLRPFIKRHVAEQSRERSRERSAASMQMAFVHAQRLRGEARYFAHVALELGLEPLGALVDVAGFKVLELRPEDSSPWTFERAILKRILGSLAGCSDVGIVLRAGRLVVRYKNSSDGRGQFVLLDQGVRSSGDVFRVDLPAHHEQPKPQQAVNAIGIDDADRTNGAGRTPT